MYDEMADVDDVFTLLAPDYKAKIKFFEGFVGMAYKPRGEKFTGNNYTIGYGHFGARKGETITEEKALELLQKDLKHVLRTLERSEFAWILPKLTKGQLTAVVDFCFNVGCFAFLKSTLCRKMTMDLNDPTIPEEFGRWVYSGKKVLKGLITRRGYNISLWKSGV